MNDRKRIELFDLNKNKKKIRKNINLVYVFNRCIMT